mmetsp:Transcript_126063/g.368406  ORF Transcript_126063/g.368406 Transcript_126063/m.368406 type:complete len:213 (+) Transcript_126063:63-701(+)
MRSVELHDVMLRSFEGGDSPGWPPGRWPSKRGPEGEKKKKASSRGQCQTLCRSRACSSGGGSASMAIVAARHASVMSRAHPSRQRKTGAGRRQACPTTAAPGRRCIGRCTAVEAPSTAHSTSVYAGTCCIFSRGRPGPPSPHCLGSLASVHMTTAARRRSASIWCRCTGGGASRSEGGPRRERSCRAAGCRRGSTRPGSMRSPMASSAMLRL